MKKKSLWAILATVIMALPLFVGFGGASVQAEAAENKNTASITVHKVENPGTEINNTGEELSGYTPIKGVKFEIWDITTTPEVKIGQTLTTDVNGEVTFPDLPKTQKVGDEMVYSKYQIREVWAPEYVTTIMAKPIDVQFPVYGVDADGNDKELDPIHIYPKNEVFGAAPKFEKYGRVGNNGKEAVLPGAAFKMYRLDKEGNKKYLQPLGKDDLGNDETPSDITWGDVNTAETFTSNGEGIVSVEDRNANYLLPEGTYYFEETQTASTEYALPKDKVITVVIGKNAEGPTFEYTVNPDYASNEEGNEGGENEIPRVVNQAAKLTKEKVSEGSDFNYGQAIEYKVTVDVPKTIATDYSRFNVTDTPDKGLIFDANSLVVGSLVKGTDYLLTSDPAFKIDFDIDPDTDGLQLSKNVKALAGKTLEINYKMSIEEGTKPDKDLNNSAVVNLTPAPTKPVKPDPVETYGKKFMKVDSADDNKKLDGAKFAVKNADGEYLTLVDGKYVWARLTDVKVGTPNLVVLESVGGAFEITGLKAGDYKLEELDAPDGYVMLLNDIDFTVTADGYNNSEAIMDVANTQKGKLPSTGGTGIIAFVAIGIVAVAGAVLYFTKGRRQIEG